MLRTSRSGVVVHGIPNEHERLREGEVVGIDFACFKDGLAHVEHTVAVTDDGPYLLTAA